MFHSRSHGCDPLAGRESHGPQVVSQQGAQSGEVNMDAVGSGIRSQTGEDRCEEGA
jgi:hypothetical protein